MRHSPTTLCRVCTTACLVTLVGVAAAQGGELADYKPARKVSGTIRVCGSPQMGDLLKLYEQGFLKVQPNVHFDEQLSSTLTAVAGVYTDRADIGLLGREIWLNEARVFESIKGHAPTVIDVATGSYDVPKATFALMVFVPKSNPIGSLSIRQLERIFASDEMPIRTWGDLGLKDDWASRPIHLYGFSIDNDKSHIFRQLVFRNSERWNPALNEFTNAAGPNGSDAGESIVEAVAKDPNAIGISNVHYASASVKALALSTNEHITPIAPTRETVANRSYPLARAVYMVLNSDAAHPLSPAVREFLNFVLSRQGQLAVSKEGNYIPLTPEIALRQLESLPRLPEK